MATPPRDATSPGADGSTSASTSPAQKWAPALGALAAVGAFVGAVVALLGLRRRRRPPLSPAQRGARLVATSGGALAESLAPVVSAGGRAAATGARRAAGLGAGTAVVGARAAASAGRLGAASARDAASHAAGLAPLVVGTARRAGGAGSAALDAARRATATVVAAPATAAGKWRELRRRWRKGKRMVRTALAFGAGYVVGTRAGRERYEKLKEAAAQVAQRPEVQQVADRLKESAGRKLPSRAQSPDSRQWEGNT